MPRVDHANSQPPRMYSAIFTPYITCITSGVPNPCWAMWRAIGTMRSARGRALQSATSTTGRLGRMNPIAAPSTRQDQSVPARNYLYEGLSRGIRRQLAGGGRSAEPATPTRAGRSRPCTSPTPRACRPRVQVLADRPRSRGVGRPAEIVVHEAVVDPFGAEAARGDFVDAVLAAVIDVGVEVALVGFDPLQLGFHRSPLDEHRRSDGRSPRGP